jgi:hypothetical protein
MMQMFTIVVMELDGTVRDVIGPFWELPAAMAFADRNVAGKGLRYAVRQLQERGVWLDGMRRHEAQR